MEIFVGIKGDAEQGPSGACSAVLLLLQNFFVEFLQSFFDEIACLSAEVQIRDRVSFHTAKSTTCDNAEQKSFDHATFAQWR
ncbi:MAG: hypothetical protein HFH53_07035 [Hespellia sp.]|jgi:hypothetical protein|nr:hypothetical protein [Hespellia sp.]